MKEITHPRTREAAARCKFPGSCHDCAMTCPHGNSIKDPEDGSIYPCGSDVFDPITGHIILCGECQQDQKEANV